jgi:phosphatidylinositol glycan class N
LGIDSNGHGHKPNSLNYLNNIKTVDDGIKDIVNLFESHFGDGKYVF